ncbi:MAG TPA: methyltransferase domain-containing protein [Candidatus Hydrogenedentes bacterium]|nr:methyltransferase domain-containing protein [Candidatus Hydrogenedentota bacterium]
MLRAFIRMNQRCCAWLEPHLPTARRHTYKIYTEVAAEHANRPEVRLAVDIGGGKTCAYVPATAARQDLRIIAIDISPAELRHNHDVNARMVSDVTCGLPLRDASVDLMTSRSVLEHLTNLEAFLREAQRIMRPGGYFIHWIPCKFAPFALINQALPNWLAKKVLYYIEPDVQGICGFPAKYDRCYPAALRRLLDAAGFEIISLKPSYFQRYFSFFVPLFLMNALYELILQGLGAENLCAHALIVARRRKDHENQLRSGQQPQGG